MAQNPDNSNSRIAGFSAEAKSDLAEIYDDTADFWGDNQAETYTNFLLDSAQLLANAPKIAPTVPDFPPLRVYVARWKNARQGHRIFYRETAEGIEVVRVLHTKRHWPEYFG